MVIVMRCCCLAVPWHVGGLVWLLSGVLVRRLVDLLGKMDHFERDVIGT